MSRRVARSLAVMSALLMVGAFAAVARAEDAPKAVGEWTLKIMTDDGQTLQGGLKLTQDGDKIKGLFTGPDGTEAKTEEVTAKGDDLAVKVVLDFQGTELVAKFKLKVAGDALKGNVEYDLGGQTGTLDVVGERKASGAKIGEGNWDLAMKTDDGQELKAGVKLAKDGDKLGGKFIGVDGTEAKIEDAAVKDGELSFKVVLDFQGSELVAKFKLKAADAGAKGTVDYDLGGQTGTLEVVGKRPAAAAGGALGKWDLEVVTADGQTLKSTINVEKDGDKVAGKFIGQDGKEVKLEDPKLDGDNLAFTINLDFEGTALNAKFKGKIEGDAIKGAVDYDLAGQTGTLDFKGKRAGDAKDAK
jgi:hypothetical protein